MHPLVRRVPGLQSLAVFEAAARLGSFTDAGRELGITQPGVSRHIARLERDIGLELFHRSANRVRLNANGESLLTAIGAGFDTIDATIESLLPADPAFVLAANPGFAQQWLLPYLDDLRAVLDETDLHLKLFDRDGELTDETYDAAIHLTSVKLVPAGSRILFDEVVLPVASPDFAAAAGLHGDTSPAAVLGVTKLHLDRRDRQWMDWAGWFAAHGVAWSPAEARLSYNNYALVVNDVVAGRGVALAWRGLIDPLLDSGTLVSVGPEVHNPGNAYQLIPGQSGSPALIDLLAGWLARLQA